MSLNDSPTADIVGGPTGVTRYSMTIIKYENRITSADEKKIGRTTTLIHLTDSGHLDKGFGCFVDDLNRQSNTSDHHNRHKDKNGCQHHESNEYSQGNAYFVLGYVGLCCQKWNLLGEVTPWCSGTRNTRSNCSILESNFSRVPVKVEQ